MRGKRVPSQPTHSLKEPTIMRYIKNNMFQRKLRSILTISSITVCVMFFVLFASLSQGIHYYIMSQIEDNSAKIGVYIPDTRTPLNESEYAALE